MGQSGEASYDLAWFGLIWAAQYVYSVNIHDTIHHGRWILASDHTLWGDASVPLMAVVAVVVVVVAVVAVALLHQLPSQSTINFSLDKPTVLPTLKRRRVLLADKAN